MKRILFLLCFPIPFFLRAQEYNAALIPDSLQENANAVKRNEELDIIIESVNKVLVKHKYAITVLNEKGDNYAAYANNYSSLIDLKDISGTLYDGLGKKIKTVRKKDIADVMEEDGFSLITDDREKKQDFFYRQYPYTVEYEDEQEFTGTLFLPDWYPEDEEGVSVMESSFSVQMPPGFQIRYKQFNYPGQDNSARISQTNVLSWEIKNLRAIKAEVWQPPLSEVTPCVLLAPVNFSWGGYSGDMNNWADFGKFQNQLNTGRTDLPDAIKQEVHLLTDTAKNIPEKVQILYRYLQANTRYIGIQLGIGGWQPLPAKFVAEKKYGDCKALTNYMISLLQEAGVKADYVEVNAGKRLMYHGLYEDFPDQAFNHVICCVPDGKDSIWLETTDQTISCGYLSSFTGNRKAFLIDESGGHIVNTPSYTSEDNQQRRNIQATIDSEGNLTAKVDTRYKGFEQDDLQLKINSESNEKLMDGLKEAFDLPTYDINNFHYDEQKGTIPAVDEKITITAPGYAIISGKRLFIMPDLLTRNSTQLISASKRKYAIEYPFSFIQADSLTIQIPSGYSVESMPHDVTINNKFGTYRISYTVTDDHIYLNRYYERSAGKFPATDYQDLSQFYDQMFSADRKKIVFVHANE